MRAGKAGFSWRSVLVPKSTVFADSEAFAIAAQLLQAVVFGLARLQALRGRLVRCRHGPVPADVFLALLSPCVWVNAGSAMVFPSAESRASWVTRGRVCAIRRCGRRARRGAAQQRIRRPAPPRQPSSSSRQARPETGYCCWLASHAPSSRCEEMAEEHADDRAHERESQALEQQEAEQPPRRGAERAHHRKVVAALLERGVERDEHRKARGDHENDGKGAQRLRARR